MRDVAERLLLVVAAEGAVASEENVGEHANRPDVGFQRQRLVLDDFWGDKVGRALDLANALSALDSAGKSEITQFQSVCKR